MVEKGITKECADCIGEYVQMSGSESLAKKLISNEKLNTNSDARNALEEMIKLFRYCEAAQITDKVA